MRSIPGTFLFAKAHTNKFNKNANYNFKTDQVVFCFLCTPWTPISRASILFSSLKSSQTSQLNHNSCFSRRVASSKKWRPIVSLRASFHWTNSRWWRAWLLRAFIRFSSSVITRSSWEATRTISLIQRSSRHFRLFSPGLRSSEFSHATLFLSKTTNRPSS